MIKSINSLSDINVSRILRLIWIKKRISRVEIANQLGIDKSTVTKIVNSLNEIGIITETEEGATGPQGGRKPIYLEIMPKFVCVGGIEINPERFVCCLLDLHGSILFQHQETIQPEEFASLKIEGVFAKAYRLIAYEALKLGVVVIGIGVGLPGLVNSDAGAVVRSIPLMIDDWYPFVQSIAQYTDIPVSVENDARCCCFGELMAAEDELAKNMIYVLTEYRVLQPKLNSKKNLSVGLGIVINGALLRGADYSAGEFRSLLCEDGGQSQFLSNVDSLDLASIIMDNGQTDSVFHELARHIAFLVNTLNVQIVCIGGVEEKYGRKIEELIKQRFERQWPYGGGRQLEVRLSSFGNMGVAYGAAAMYIEQLFSLPSLATASEKGPSLLKRLAAISQNRAATQL